MFFACRGGVITFLASGNYIRNEGLTVDIAETFLVTVYGPNSTVQGTFPVVGWHLAGICRRGCGGRSNGFTGRPRSGQRAAGAAGDAVHCGSVGSALDGHG